MTKKRFIKRFFFLLILALSISCVAIVSLQGYLIFPMLLTKFRDPPPLGTVSELRNMSAGNKLEVWIRDANPSGKLTSTGAIAIIFCGNSGGLLGQYHLQAIFSDWGIKSYLIDYPGYGRSTGWPSEELINDNAQEMAMEILSRENTDNSRLIIAGNSIGTGFAAQLASKIQPRVLFLISGYADFANLVSERNSLFCLLVPFLKYHMATAQAVSLLDKTNLIAIHGTEDTIIPSKHLTQIADSYQGTGKLIKILTLGANHNNVLAKTSNAVQASLINLLQ